MSLQQVADLSKVGPASSLPITCLHSSQKLGVPSQTADVYIQISKCWGLRGEVVRVGEFYCKAAKEVIHPSIIFLSLSLQVEVSDPQRAKSLYFEGIDYLCPAETTVEQMSSSCPAIATDIFANVFKFVLKHRSSSKTPTPSR
jgi:hypothetical protein